MARTKRARKSATTSNAALDNGPQEDKFSELPKDVIDVILKKVTTRDVARMSMLSKKWKHVWDTQDTLVLDAAFYMRTKTTVRRNGTQYIRRISNILALHEGDLRRFDFCVPFRQNFDIDLLILTLSRKKIKELIFSNDFRYSPNNYRIPSYIYQCQELRYLELNRCFMYMNPPRGFNGFQNLHTLVLKFYTFTPGFGNLIQKLPMLGTLRLTACNNVPFIEELPTSLHTFEVDFSPDFDWGMLRRKSYVTKFVICLFGGDIWLDIRRNEDEYFNMITLLYNLPYLNFLSLDGFSFKYLAKGVQLNHINGVGVCAYDLKELFISGVVFNDLETVKCLLSLLRSARNLESIEITGVYLRVTDEKPEVVRCMEYGAVRKLELEKLTTVTLMRLNGLQTEMHLIKSLYAQSPSLKNIIMDFRRGIGNMLQTRVLEETSKFPRASKDVQTYYKFFEN